MSRTKAKLLTTTASIKTAKTKAEPRKRKRKLKVVKPREALVLIQPQAMSILQFAQAHDLSIDTYFQMNRDGIGPVTMKVGGRTLISNESAAEWRREREAASRKRHEQRRAEREKAEASTAVEA